MMLRRRPMYSAPYRQRGAALAVVMIMLLVMLLLGVAILRGTMLEQRMSANLYDRSIAFESAERALREAELAVNAAVKGGTVIGRDCSTPGKVCAPLPADTYVGGASTCGAPASCWTAASQGDAKVPSAGRPQYYVDFMGRRTSADDFGTANGNPYEPGSAPLINAAYYRVTARSHDPSQARDRAVVVLQSTMVSF